MEIIFSDRSLIEFGVNHRISHLCEKSKFEAITSQKVSKKRWILSSAEADAECKDFTPREVVVMEDMEVHSSVPIQLTTSRTTLVLVCFSIQTAELWGTHSRLWPSTARSLSPHLSLPSLLAGLSGTTNNTWTGSGLRSVPGSAPPEHHKEVTVRTTIYVSTRANSFWHKQS